MLLYHWKLLTKESFIPGNSGNSCYTPWTSNILLWLHVDTLHPDFISSIHLEISCLQHPVFCSRIAYYILFKLFYPDFFLFIFSDVSRGSFSIPLHTPKDTNLQSGSRLNFGNYLVDEISITFFIHCLKGSKVTFLSQNKFWLALKWWSISVL